MCCMIELTNWEKQGTMYLILGVMKVKKVSIILLFITLLIINLTGCNRINTTEKTDKSNDSKMEFRIYECKELDSRYSFQVAGMITIL